MKLLKSGFDPGKSSLFVPVAAIFLFTIFVGIILLILLKIDRITDRDPFQYLAVSLIIGWIIALIAYYTWAIDFYNIRLGGVRRYQHMTKMQGEALPVENPNKDQTLGLPPGTVRGTIALSLLVGGLSMTIVALTLKDTTPPDAILRDNFQFFKDAFLMMIAFYFGAKSLEILQSDTAQNKADKTATEKAPPVAMGNAAAGKPLTEPPMAATTGAATTAAATTAKKILQEESFTDTEAKG